MTLKENTLIYEIYREASRRAVLKGIGSALIKLVVPTVNDLLPAINSRIPNKALDLEYAIEHYALNAHYGNSDSILRSVASNPLRYKGKPEEAIIKDITDKVINKTIDDDILKDLIFRGNHMVYASSAKLCIKFFKLTLDKLLNQCSNKNKEFAKEEFAPYEWNYINGEYEDAAESLADRLEQSAAPENFVIPFDLKLGQTIIYTKNELMSKGIMKEPMQIYNNIQNDIKKYIREPIKKIEAELNNKEYSNSIEYSPADKGSSATQTRTLGGESLKRPKQNLKL